MSISEIRLYKDWLTLNLGPPSKELSSGHLEQDKIGKFWYPVVNGFAMDEQTYMWLSLSKLNLDEKT